MMIGYRIPVSAALILLVLCAGCSSKSTEPEAPPNPSTIRDTVWISSDTVSAGDTAVVHLNLTNPDSAVASLNIWLQSSSSAVLFDTTASVAPRFPAGMTWTSQRQDTINAMSVIIVDFNAPLAVIAPGSGPLMEIRYVVSPAAVPGTYTLDTTSLVLPKPVDIDCGAVDRSACRADSRSNTVAVAGHF
jgi:hypothetical protein